MRLPRALRRLLRREPQRPAPPDRCGNPYRRFYTNDNTAPQLARAGRAQRAKRRDRHAADHPAGASRL